jgi:hypothetical protein
MTRLGEANPAERKVRTMLRIRTLAILGAVTGAVIIIGVPGSAAERVAPSRAAVPTVPTVPGPQTSLPKPVWLPEELLQSGASAVYSVPAGLPVGKLDGFSFFAIPGKEHQVCLMGLRGRGATAVDFGACGPRSYLKDGAIWAGIPVGKGMKLAAGFLPDGYTKVSSAGRSAAVGTNVFLLKVPSRARRITATGPSASKRHIQFGAKSGARRPQW